MTLADTNAVKTRIESVPILDGQTFVTKAEYAAPNQKTPVTLPYVVIHPGEGVDDASRYVGPISSQHPKFVLHIVGGSATQVQTVAELVKPKFLVDGVPDIPAVAGRSNKHFYWDSPLPIQTDADVMPALLFMVVELGWASDPA